MDTLKFLPLTSEHREDIVKLFGSNGAWGICWCMWWNLSKSTFEKPGFKEV